MGTGKWHRMIASLLATAAVLLALCGAEDVAPSTVVELTMENFVEVVTDSKKNVLVKFYAPWCGHCKEFAPVYDKIAESYKGDESMVVAKVDAEAHAVFAKMCKVTAYPTLKIFPKKEKKGITYEGDRTEDKVKHFVGKETFEAEPPPTREPPKIVTRDDGTIEMTETFYHYGDGMPPM